MEKYIVLKLEDAIREWESFFRRTNPDLDRYQQYLHIKKINQAYLDLARAKLDIVLDHPIICVESTETRNGEYDINYHVITTCNIADCFDTSNGNVWYLDENGDLSSEGDFGYYRRYSYYRELNNNSDIAFLEDLFSSQNGIKKLFDRTSKIGDKIAPVYGWNKKEKEK